MVYWDNEYIKNYLYMDNGVLVVSKSYLCFFVGIFKQLVILLNKKQISKIFGVIIYFLKRIKLLFDEVYRWQLVFGLFFFYLENFRVLFEIFKIIM